MVETYNLKYDIEVLSTERDALTKEVEALNAKQDDLFEGVRDAEQMKRVEIPIMPQRTILMLKKRGFANNYWEHVHRTVKIDVKFILSRGLRFKRLLSE